MSEMKMNYIFIEKETQDSISMCEQIAEAAGCGGQQDEVRQLANVRFHLLAGCGSVL